MPSAPSLAAYAVYEHDKLARLTLLNLAHRNTTDSADTGSVSVNLQSLVGKRGLGKVKVKRMTAPGMESKEVDLVTWAGQAYTNGTASGEEEIEDVKDGVVIVNGVEGVIVFFDSASRG